MNYSMEEYDIAVIGAGHAGVEAALAAARLGCKTALFTISLDGIANLPCNPSIGGTAKGHLVREIDALGGEMGKAADVLFAEPYAQSGKGPAVHSLRVQADRVKYHNYMKSICEAQENLSVKQAEVTAIETDENNHVTKVITRLGAEYAVKAAILATGTFLRGKIHVGETSYFSGPDNVLPPMELSENLQKIGIKLRRLQNGNSLAGS